MTVDEIFTKLADHALQGVMFHCDLRDYYAFLGLYGYKEFHEEQSDKEKCYYRELKDYYLCHYRKLIQKTGETRQEVIPKAWYGVDRNAVDSATRQAAVKQSLDLWITYQSGTKKLLQQMFKELMNIDQVAAALKLGHYIKKVDHQLAEAQKYKICKKATGYDMTQIMQEQNK